MKTREIAVLAGSTVVCSPVLSTRTPTQYRAAVVGQAAAPTVGRLPALSRDQAQAIISPSTGRQLASAVNTSVSGPPEWRYSSVSELGACECFLYALRVSTRHDT